MVENDEKKNDSACLFCWQDIQARAVATCGTVLAIEDDKPVVEGHLLIITRRHTADLFSMNDQEKRDAFELVAVLRDRALRTDPKITGFNVGANCGASAGQRIMHAHIHFIPRRDGEDENGSVKGVIRNKMTY